MSAAEEFTKRERSQRALEHYVETGHTIDSTESTIRPRSPPAPEDILVRDLLG